MNSKPVSALDDDVFVKKMLHGDSEGECLH